jgi:hypothetical protein
MKPKKLAARVDDTMLEYDEYTRTYSVLGNGFLAKDDLQDGDTLRVDNLSGCNGVFFFDGAGKASVAHIIAGTEASETADAATKAKAAGTVTAVKVYSQSVFNFNAIKAKINIVLGARVPVTQVPYTHNTADRTERNGVTYTVGDTTNSLTPLPVYHCQM